MPWVVEVLQCGEMNIEVIDYPLADLSHVTRSRSVPKVAQAACEVRTALPRRALVDYLGCPGAREQIADFVIAKVSDKPNATSARAEAEACCSGVTLDCR